ncbi:hypothetical protein D478_12416 [Brevibacillus agri BAB-2500]|nr:hypothetical protein D478_12416 [Brevibacillus agri BAB-2500]
MEDANPFCNQALVRKKGCYRYSLKRIGKVTIVLYGRTLVAVNACQHRMGTMPIDSQAFRNTTLFTKRAYNKAGRMERIYRFLSIIKRDGCLFKKDIPPTHGGWNVLFFCQSVQAG